MVSFALVKAVAGWWSWSLALLSDAGQILIVTCTLAFTKSL